LLTLIIDTTNVHDYVASFEDSRVTGTLHVCYTASVELPCNVRSVKRVT
jgi:hypothetical protein